MFGVERLSQHNRGGWSLTDKQEEEQANRTTHTSPTALLFKGRGFSFKVTGHVGQQVKSCGLDLHLNWIQSDLGM